MDLNNSKCLTTYLSVKIFQKIYERLQQQFKDTFNRFLICRYFSTLPPFWKKMCNLNGNSLSFQDLENYILELIPTLPQVILSFLSNSNKNNAVIMFRAYVLLCSIR